MNDGFHAGTFKPEPSNQETEGLVKGTFGELACRCGIGANGAEVVSVELNVEEVLV